jgi:hypothetical protein
MAIAIAILGLWTAIGGGVGSAIAGAVWTQRLPRLLAENLGAYYTPAELAEIYGDIYVAKISEPRAIVIASKPPLFSTKHSWWAAYDSAIRPLFIAAVATSCLSLFCNFFMTDFYLDDRQNAIESTKVQLRSAEETDDEKIAAAARAKEERIRLELERGV